MPSNSSRPASRRTGKEILVERSRGNVFADIGLPDADVLLVKADLAVRIGAIIAARRLTQREASKILGIDQPGVSDLLRGQLRRYSSDRLFRFLNALGQDIDIVITSRGLKHRDAGRLRVRDSGASTRAAHTRSRT